MASSSRNNKKYDVFVSFRGEDTRDNFSSHLYSALSRQNIQTFIDDQLNRGDEISESLVNAIEASAISVIVFSEGYASSRWCLDELVKILECKKEYAQIVIPVFYRVDPSDVRNQTGSFGNSFSKLEERFKENSKKLQTWRNALKEAATLSGFPSQNIRLESKLINEIANHILKRLVDQVFRPNDNKNQLVGVESRVEEIESLLGAQSKDVYALGIWGIGGIGKATIARATFDKISSDFEGSCFLENVREESQKPGGLACLRQKLLSNLLKDKNVSLDIGLNFRRLSRMKVLIVFDDVTCFSQLESIIGSLDCLTPVSRIIITTRNKQVLRNWGVRKIYEMEALEYHHALELFSRHAFKQSHPDVGYEKFSSKVMKYAQGVPLALKVLGCFLYEREKEVWESAINKLQRILHPSILEVLKISYDSLDDKEKNIFLDVACFFQGENVNLVMKFHDASGFYPEIGISILVDKSLIAIGSYNQIRMHDLLQELGREIVRQESINPGNRSRLWHHEDIYEVLTYNTSLPSNLSAEKLVLLEVPGSSIEQLWDGVKHYSKLNQIIHVACKKLIAKTPNPTLMPHLNKLVILILRGSKSLKSLPAEIFNLECLTELDLSDCSKLKRLPEILSVSFDQSNNFNLKGHCTAGIVNDALRIQHIGHLLAVRWKEMLEKGDFSMDKGHILLPGNEIPKWFKFQSVGSFITWEMPPDFFNNSRVQGIVFSAILAFSDRHVDCGRWFSFSFELKVKTTKDCGPLDTRLFQSRVNYVESYHLHLGYYMFCEEDFNGFWKCNCIPEAVHFNVFPPLECQCCGVKKCGIHLLHTPDSTNSM
ncbi:ADP-ribosyl cyclase/cyclic ADP-ribose hydrolase [Citrus sinensis]|uniref:ADP-ribosyl cyclase/cyclic ADP-ribose hydrolase n=1 Tax=Citrus sinensis TaxID=2711 RepID=A0ACB8M9J4_CITSI|nr:ADP-ribosyl cyclase/cyclic ADP-ribose hydrolase [Citrus sinensis]